MEDGSQMRRLDNNNDPKVSTLDVGELKLPVQACRDDNLEDLVIQAKDYFLSHGLAVRTINAPKDANVAQVFRFNLLPSPVPRRQYEQALAIQKDYNLLIHRISLDHSFLKECLQQILQYLCVLNVDSFTRNLWKVYDTVMTEGPSQSYSLGMNRCDYMLDCGIPAEQVISSGVKIDPATTKLRLVEINTMAAGCNGNSSHLKDYHRFILQRLGWHDDVHRVPPRQGESRAVEIHAQALLTAWRCYDNHRSVILFLVLDDERNIYDQRHVEYAVYDLNPRVKVIRRTMKDLVERAVLNPDKTLVIDGNEVAVVYQRVLYSPDHFPSQEYWTMRLTIERSRAIKCPTAGYHLAGTKKVQEVLTKPGVLERFLSRPESIKAIRETFTGQHSLDLDDEGDESAAMAIRNPQLYVMKPQREGGGNNLFGDDISRKLVELGRSEERTAYTLMDRIHAFPVQSYLIRIGDPVKLHHCVGELGIFGSFLGTAEDIVVNSSGGGLLRTKPVGVDECGGSAGYGFTDSPYLI